MSTDTFDMAAAPMRIGKVRLNVRDLDAMTQFYRNVLGLAELTRGGTTATLGVGQTPLLELAADPERAQVDRRQAGLFHTAFLMPTRGDLARWLRLMADHGVRLQGASDHIVSEAIYLADPEGNGIEVYADRPVQHWRDARGDIRMTTEPLDVANLLADAGGSSWRGFPESGSIGHVHLQVGDTTTADRFYRDVLGFDVALDYPGASFYGSGGYHHQLAANVWNSRGAGLRPSGMAGLDAVEVLVRDRDHLSAIVDRAESGGLVVGAGTVLHDPWGTAIVLTEVEN